MLKKTYKPAEVRALEGIGPTTFFERLKRGEYDSVGTGHARRITEESIERRREKHAQKPVA